MKKLILKTALITLGSAIVVLVAVFGLMSLWAPAIMMDFTASLGLDSISGDYAYQEYERSGKIDYLARSFIVSAHVGENEKAMKRFNLLRDSDEFEPFCKAQSDIQLTEKQSITYESYLYAQGVVIMYRTSPKEDWKDICDKAIEKTDASFPIGNPVAALATEAISKEDSAFCAVLLEEFVNAEWNENQIDYMYFFETLTKLTGGMANE